MSASPCLSHRKHVAADTITFANLKRVREAPQAQLLFTRYSAASDMTENGTRASQPSRNCFSHARSVTSCTARSAKCRWRGRAPGNSRRMAARGPAMHHRVGHVGMKLEAEAMIQSKRFRREVASLRQQFGAVRKFKSLAVASGIAGQTAPMRLAALAQLKTAD